MEALHSFLSEELLHSGIHLPVQYTVHNEVLLHTVLHRFLPEQEMLLPWLYHRDLLKRVFRDDLAVFSERCICYILDFHDVLLNFLLYPVSFVSMVILPTQKGIIDQIISQIMPISYLFSNSFVVNSILFHAPSFLRWQESLTCLHDYFIKYHEHRRQYEDYDYHTDQCSSRHQDTQGTDHIDIGVKSYTDRCCEEA